MPITPIRWSPGIPSIAGSVIWLFKEAIFISPFRLWLPSNNLTTACLVLFGVPGVEELKLP